MTDFSEIHYRRNYLDKVLVRVDLVNPMADIESNFPAEIGKIIKPLFPISEPQKAFHGEIRIMPNEKPVAVETEFTQWTFHGLSREKTLIFTPAFIVFTYNKYESYGSVREEFDKIFTSVFKYFQDLQPQRLGLRYINKIKIDSKDPLDWKGFIKSELWSTIYFSSQPECISRVFHNIEHNYGDYNLRFQFGIHNTDYPQPIRKKEFVLDYDAYSKILTDPKEIVSIFDRFHSAIQTYFEKSITEKLRRRMNARRTN